MSKQTITLYPPHPHETVHSVEVQTANPDCNFFLPDELWKDIFGVAMQTRHQLMIEGLDSEDDDDTVGESDVEGQ
jgi:hypothetical protein